MILFSFLTLLPNFLILKLFQNLWGRLHIQFLVMVGGHSRGRCLWGGVSGSVAIGRGEESIWSLGLGFYFSRGGILGSASIHFFVRQFERKMVYIVLFSRYYVLVYLWWIEITLKSWNVSYFLSTFVAPFQLMWRETLPKT